MTEGFCHTGSSASFLRMKNRRCAPKRCMKAVPGVMQLESKSSSLTVSPSLWSLARACSRYNLMAASWALAADLTRVCAALF